MKFLVQLVLALIVIAPAVAQDLPMRRVKADNYPYLTPVVIARTSTAVFSEQAKLLAFAHEPLQQNDISIFALDDSGTPSVTPIAQIVLPAVAALKDRDNYPLDIRLHPRLPILYVFRDVKKSADADAPLEAVYETLPRVLVYGIEPTGAKLLQSLCPGSLFWKGSAVGFLQLDSDAKRLYVSNLLRGEPGNQEYGIAYLDVGADGLIKLTADKQPSMKQFFAANFYTGNCTGGIEIISDDTIIWSSMGGPTTAKLTEPDCTTHYVWLWPPRYRKRIALHPTLPVMYFSNIGEAYVQMIEHAAGYPTMMPTYASVSGPMSPPVVMAKHNFVAMGGKNFVNLLCIDAQGRYTGEIHYVNVKDPDVRAVAYSPKFDRLYVSEEPSP